MDGFSGSDAYLLLFKNVSVSSAGANLELLFGTGSTPTYETSGYNNNSEGGNTSGSGYTAGNSCPSSECGSSFIQLNGVSNGIYSAAAYNGFVHIQPATVAGEHAAVGFVTYINNSSQTHAWMSVAGDDGGSAGAALTAIKVTISTGTFGGTLSLYSYSQ